MKFYRLILLMLFLAGWRPAWCPASPPQNLQPDQIALIVNTDNADSQALAHYYCLKRRVPKSHIIALTMPGRELITRREYDRQIAPLIRQRLRRDDLQDKIKCLLTVRGVPLRIDNFVPEGPTLKWRDLIIQQLDERFGQLARLTDNFNRLAGKIPPLREIDPSEADFKMSRNLRERQKLAQSMLNAAARTAAAAQDTLDKLKPSDPNLTQKLLRLEQLYSQWDGLQGQYVRLDQRLKTLSNPKEKQSLQKQLLELQSKLLSLNNRLKQIDQASPDADVRKEKYQVIYQALGLSGLCRVLLADRINIDDEESSCAFDSELSLILWPTYPLSGWQKNNLRAGPIEVIWLPDPADQTTPPPTLMVARIDGPTLEIARGLIDKALAAEKILLRGTAYIDARGKHKSNPPFGSPEYTDQSLRQTADYLKKNTALKVVLDDKEALFAGGACPDATLYCGWYSLRNYIDSFEFHPGAVGYHIASFEAETLRAGSPDSNIWCKRLLEKGITATLGAVAEPYLHGMPLPDQFFADLVSGKYCLVECCYRAKPFNSWRLTLIGDPLYRPRFASTCGFRPVKFQPCPY